MKYLSSNENFLKKTKELCSLLVESQEYKKQIQKVEAFSKDEESQNKYQNLINLGETLHNKQQLGSLTEEEIQEYESKKLKLKENKIIDDFLTAEDYFNELLKEISLYVSKSIELGKAAEEEDLIDVNENCCSSNEGCGC